MLSRNLFIAAAVAALGFASAAQAQLGPQAERPPVAAKADLILKNGHVYTPSGWVSAVAVHRGVIIGLGDDTSVAPLSDAATHVIDLKGETVLPGLYDMHVHPTGAGISEMQCQLPQGSTPEQIFAITAGCAKIKKPGEWITGRAYEAGSFGNTPPNRYMLDKVAPNNPVVFTDISGHSSWANSMALKLAGITRDTPNPKNGIIERDAKGEPTGLLRESAAGLVSRLVPPPNRETNARALKWSLDTMLAQGITGLDDALVSEDIAQAYADLSDHGELHQHVRGCLMYAATGLIARRDLYERDRFSPSCIKIILDGVPTDSHTAAMLGDYEPLPGRSDAGREKGILMVDPNDLDVLLVHYDSMGMTVKMHAAGDAAVREGLDAIAAARKANGFSGLLHDVAHNSFVAMNDIERARSIGAVFEFSPYIWYPSPIVDDIRKAVGEERMKRWIPIKDALNAGAFIVIGSDWAVVPTVNPWIAIETLVTRQVPGGGGEALGAQEAISLKQAFDAYTINAARQQYAADRRGSIELGKEADLIVVDRNIFEAPITTIHDTKVLKTIIHGDLVYDASHPVPARP